ncbi:hypothetical protein CKJ90_32480, partial [Klebsiella pneumoniae]
MPSAVRVQESCWPIFRLLQLFIGGGKLARGGTSPRSGSADAVGGQGPGELLANLQVAAAL